MQQPDFMTPLFVFAEKYIPEIDKACEEAHPRAFDLSYLNAVSGPVTYSDTSLDLTLALSQPNWDLLDRTRSRIRPIIFLLIAGGLGKDLKEVIRYSAIPELIHNGTLIHDDIEDAGLIRRNDKTIHLKYGTDIAVNSANLLYFSPFTLLKKYGKDLPSSLLIRAYEIITEHLNRVTWGQGLDIYWHNHFESISVKNYYQMCAYKTGAIDRLTASLASVFAEINPEIHQKVEQFGEELGIGLQIHDDFLDVCAVQRDLFGGKPTGNDISEGKKSLIVILTLQNLPSPKKERFELILSQHTSDPHLLAEALDLIEQSGVLEEVLKAGQNQFRKIQELSHSLFTGECEILLTNFAKGIEDDLGYKYDQRKKY